MGWQFIGRLGKNNVVIPNAIPFTAWQSSAVYSNKPCVVLASFTLNLDEEDVAGQYEVRAYMALHVEIQRRQPTVVAVQQAMDQLEQQHGQPPTLAEVRAWFEGAHPMRKNTGRRCQKIPKTCQKHQYITKRVTESMKNQ